MRTIISAVVIALCCASVFAAEPGDDKAWRSLFDGKSLGDWKVTQFGTQGEVTVEDGQIILSTGADMTGVTYTGEVPRVNYEVSLEAKRIEGTDFFCGLTFPVKDENCSLILGGWGGSLVGLSSLDNEDASSNETTQHIRFEQDRWYRVRVRVTDDRIQAWLDDKRIVDVDTTGKRIGIRIEMTLSRPLGVATWQTTGALRDIKIRKLTEAEIAERD